MRLVFMGTPDFAVPALQTVAASRHEVVGVVTQPDKPKGRGKHLQAPPVKEAALELNIPVYQPEKVREESFVEELAQLNPDAIIVAAFGQLIPKTILDMPKYGCLNIHASLLPKYRGASPIQWAILNGDEKTGVTIMRMEVGLDTGAIYLQKEYPLDGTDTGGSLFDTLSELGGPLMLEALDRLEAGTLEAVPQEEEKACYVRMLKKELGRIDWSADGRQIERYIRGLNPWPAAYTSWSGKTLKLWKAEWIAEDTDQTAGTVTGTTKTGFFVQTGNGQLFVTELQLEGMKRMDAAAFLRGVTLQAGDSLGEA